MMATGSLFTFEEARAIGLVNHVWSDADLKGATFADASHEYAKQFTPPHKAAKAVGHIKRAVQSGLESSFAEGLALERELQQRLFESADAKEGLAAKMLTVSVSASPQAFTDLVREETQEWGQFLSKAKIKVN